MKTSVLLLCGAAGWACASHSSERPAKTWNAAEHRPAIVRRSDQPYRGMAETREASPATSKKAPVAHVADTVTASDRARRAEYRTPAVRAPRPSSSSEAIVTNDVNDKSNIEPKAADNTGINERDREPSALTPMDQGGSVSDLRITKQIRQAIIGDGSLSFTAKNVKVITVNGKVTLRGPVDNEQERASVDAAARRVAGPTHVENQLEIQR